jgi:23S rRNA (uracil1939-C5)-methyltransferase
MQNHKIIPFKITGMDSLGQGVSKETDKITFISKTAIGDEGQAWIQSEKKGVAFASIKELQKSSPLRVIPSCVHFNQCPSCHYLHISYEDELKFKKESLQRLFRKLPVPEIELIGAVRRLEYRNRIQLHYDVSLNKLGMLDAKSQQIIPIPQCRIAMPEVLKVLQDLYLNNQWIKEAPVPQGHLEIYWLNGKIQKNWNESYAQGGFTQVYEEMNQVMRTTLKNSSFNKSSQNLLDLFAGNGNLSEQLNFKQRLCVDYYTKNIKPDSFSLDLYSTSALKTTMSELKKKSLQPEQLLLDPPRSGMKDLNLWLEAIKPKQVAYVSCDPHTLARDIASVTHYEAKEFFLIDFFPSTFHYETLIILERKS